MRSSQAQSVESVFNVVDASSQTEKLTQVLVTTLQNRDVEYSDTVLEMCSLYLVSNTNQDDVNLYPAIDALQKQNVTIQDEPVTVDSIRSLSMLLINEYELPISPPVEALVEQIVSQIGLDTEPTFPLENAKSTALTTYEETNRSPMISAATAVYLTAKNAGIERVTQTTIASACDTTTVSIRNTLNDLREQTNIPIDIPNTKSTTQVDDVIPIFNAIHAHVRQEPVTVPDSIRDIGSDVIWANWDGHLSRCSPSLTAGMFYMAIVEGDKTVDTGGLDLLTVVANGAGVLEESLYHRYNNEADGVIQSMEDV